MQAATNFFIPKLVVNICPPIASLALLILVLLGAATNAEAGPTVSHGMFTSVEEARSACAAIVNPPPQTSHNMCSTGSHSSQRVPALSVVYALQDDASGGWMAVGNILNSERTSHIWAYYGDFCEEPMIPNPNGSGATACMKSCPTTRPFDPTIRDCAPEVAAAESEECTTCNPINFSTGDKYLVETDFTGAGGFPLKVERYYHSQRGRFYDGRQEWTYLPGKGPAQNIYYEPVKSFATQRRYSALTKIDAPLYSALLPETDDYRAHVSTKWGHTYDRFLFASFGYLTQNYNENPPVVRLYRPDGKVEHYAYTGVNYVPRNGYTSQISRLPSEHELAPGWHVVNSAGEAEIYDLKGKLLRITNAAGLSHHLSYDAATGSKLVRVEDDYGQALEFEYAGFGVPARPTLVRDPDGNEFHYEYSAGGLIAKVTYPDLTPGNLADNPFKIYHYEDANFPDALTGITDENGERHTLYAYDPTGRAILSELSNGAERVQVTYDLGSRTRTLTNSLGRQTTYTLNSAGMVLAVVGMASPSGQVDAATRTNTYSSAGFISRTTDWRGIITNYVRDARGLETSRTEAFGTGAQRTISTSWHPSLRLPTQVVEPGRTTTMTYNSLGQLLTLTETDSTTHTVPYNTNGRSRTTTFTYHPPGTNGALQLATLNGPRTDVVDVTTYEYTPEGFLSRITNALGHQVDIISHNARGLPLAIADENGVVTTFTYHPRGWLLTSTVKHPTQSSLDAITSYDYDAAGQVTKITLPNSSFLAYDYDAAHRLTSITNNLGESIAYVLDAQGNVTSQETRNASLQIKQVQMRVYDELSRLYENVGGADQLTRFDYDQNGNLLQIAADPAGLNQLTKQAFDGLNRLRSITDAMNGISDYQYDGRDNLTGVIDEGGLKTTYIYDGFDNLLQLDSPDTGITTYTYDNAGNVTSEVDARGITKQFSYDALNRVTLEHYPQNPNEDIVYRYDEATAAFGTGRLTGLEDKSGTTAYVYDHRGNQIGVTSTIQSGSYTTQFEYDLADNLERTIYPSGRIVDHELDSLGRVAAVSTRSDVNAAPVTVLSTVTYLPFGPADSMQFGNELATDTTYDQDYRLTGMSTVDASGPGGPDLQDATYVLSKVNNVEDIINMLDSARTQVFEYDLLNRLTGASGIYGVLLYDYDAVGNRMQEQRIEGSNQTAEIYTYFPDSNGIASRQLNGSFRFYQYNANGSVVSDGESLYFYDSQNRLVEVAE